MSAPELSGRREPWLIAATTLGGYELILTVMSLTLFVPPYVAFAA